MGTITSLMDIARLALSADQEALNVTSNNVANQNTAGYTREVVEFQSADTVTLSGGSFWFRCHCECELAERPRS